MSYPSVLISLRRVLTPYPRLVHRLSRLVLQGVCVVLSGEKDRAFVTHRGAVAEFCRDDIDVQRVVNSGHVHVGERLGHG